jgi:inorganic pyrophosphatase
MPTPPPSPVHTLGAFDEDGLLNAVIEASAGTRSKYTWDPDASVFRLSGLLPAGFAYPFDFGFIPSTCADDGDPVDVLVLMDEPGVPGLVVAARLVGVIEAEQQEPEGGVDRNDRLLAVARHSLDYADVHDIGDLPRAVLSQIEHFFTAFNQAKGRRFTPLGRGDAARARQLVEAQVTGRGGG